VGDAGLPATAEQRLIEVTTVDELVELVEWRAAPLYARFSTGLGDDRSV
jgi:hypothetical protein